MKKYFYVHQNHFYKYYPAEITVSENSTTYVNVAQNGVPALTSKYARDLMIRRKFKVRKMLFEMRSPMPKIRNDETLNAWFFENAIVRDERLRFITLKERNDLRDRDGYTLCGPSFEDTFRIINGIYNYYARRIDQYQGYNYLLGTYIGVRELRWFSEGSPLSVTLHQTNVDPDSLLGMIFKVYPNFFFLSDKYQHNLNGGEKRDIIINMNLSIPLKYFTNPREILGAEQELRVLLEKHRLESMMPENFFTQHIESL